ncbi:hypothetical protein [Burkholderia pyrrocinia]|uniref:hypothetical protein n=1 Tax=Burkholderia pyrrocinia TaxID=60550 RepID=UPI00158B0793|nr:hypothetical protein [Burkholderia pyrrocinia]
MEIHSQWTFDCRREHIWPHYLHARMDGTRPLLFRLGVPKPVSCSVLEGTPAVGNTRQCTTDRGTIDQRILVLDENRRLRYRMVSSTVWCRDWVGLLEDEFTLTSIEGDKTRVERRTVFSARGIFKPVRQIGLWLTLQQAHRYAARNWRSLAIAAKERAVATELASGA